MDAYVSPSELKKFHDWLLTPQEEKEPANIAFESELIKRFAFIVSGGYKQVKEFPNWPRYKESFDKNPFICPKCKEYAVEVRDQGTKRTRSRWMDRR